MDIWVLQTAQFIHEASDAYSTETTDFQRFIITQRKRDNFEEADQIGNADQTPLTFDIPHSTTIDTKGSSSVNIKTTGNEKNHLTVMLVCTADGGGGSCRRSSSLRARPCQKTIPTWSHRQEPREGLDGWNIDARLDKIHFWGNDQDPKNKFTCVGRFPVP